MLKISVTTLIVHSTNQHIVNPLIHTFACHFGGDIDGRVYYHLILKKNFMKLFHEMRGAFRA